jgi:hypothetical protein
VTRAFLSGLRVDLLQLVRSPFDMVGMLVWPLVFSSIAYLLLGRGAGSASCSVPLWGLR